MPLTGMDEMGLHPGTCVCVFSDTCTGENSFSPQCNFLKGKNNNNNNKKRVRQSLDLDIFSFRHPKGIFGQLLNSLQVQ